METPVITAWDAVVRAWLVVTAWLALRRAARPGSLARLASVTDPARFVRAAMVPAAGDVAIAIAIALLPRRRRREARITLLACKALRALDRACSSTSGEGDRGAAPGSVTIAVSYLSGESHEAPAAAGRDRLDALLIARLPMLRAALEALPGDATRRCRAMIEQVGAAMLRARTEQRGGSAHVLGEAAVYAARLAAPAIRPPDTACRAAGCALQLAADLRDAETPERRSWLVSRTLPAASELVRLARWLPASTGPGVRAAAALLVVTSCTALLREAAVALPRGLRHPLRVALAAAWSRGAYLAAATAIDGAIRDALAARPSLLDGSALVHAGPARPARLANPEPVAPASALVVLALAPPRAPEELRELTARITS